MDQKRQRSFFGTESLDNFAWIDTSELLQLQFTVITVLSVHRDAPFVIAVTAQGNENVRHLKRNRTSLRLIL